MSDRRLEQIGAAGGIGFVVLQLVSQFLLQVGGSEPRFDAPVAEIAEFFENRDSQLVWVGAYLATLSAIPFLWFLGTLWGALRRSDQEPAWLPMVAVGSGLTLVAIGLVALLFWPLAVFRIGEDLGSQAGRLLFDMGNYAFVTTWVVAASMVLATGVVALRTGALPRWLGWSSIVVAIGLLAGRLAWTSQAAFGPYVLYWVWLIAVSIILIRRAGGSERSA